MQTIDRSSSQTQGLAELETYFSGIQPPYTLGHIRHFNAIYRRLYPQLQREEMFRAETWVDLLIDNVERKEWASKIFGVV